ncbi:MAG: SurA N-terminal domain-containing protein [Pseudohongiellaceae bacterium]
MLQDIRDNSQGVVAKIIIGLIVAVFALFGLESIVGGIMRNPTVAEVNGEEITEPQLQAGAQNLLASIGGSLDSLDQQLVEQIALNQLIEEVILRQAAQRAAMRISDERIDQAIIQTPQFQIDGTFNPDLAARTIASQSYTVPGYRQALQDNMLMAQLANAYSSSAFITDAELERIAGLRTQTRDFRFIPVALGTRTLGQAISDEEIEQYYRNNQAEFTVEEQVVVDYVLLDRDELFEEIETDEALITAQYEVEREAFESESEYRASHILFETGPNLSEAEAVAQALEAKARLEAGENFGDLAMELSSDTISAEDGGDIGYSDGSAFPPEIEEAAETLAVNTVSEPIVTEFGVHLVKVTESGENIYPPYEEVAERIERELKSNEVQLLYTQMLEELSNRAFEDPDLQTITEELGLEVQRSEPMPRSGGTGVLSNPAVIDAAFDPEVLEEGHNSDVIELGPTQALVLRTVEHRAPEARPLEDVRSEIAVILRTEMERERASQIGNEIVAALRDGEPVDELLQEYELAWNEQAGAGRTAPGVNSEVLDTVFAMEKPQGDTPVYDGTLLSNGTFAVIELNAVNSGNVSSLTEPELETITGTLLDEKGQSDFGSYVTHLRNNADVTTTLFDEPF